MPKIVVDEKASKIVDRKWGKVGTDQDVKNGNKGAGL